MDEYIFTDEKYFDIAYPSSELLTDKNNMVLYDLVSDSAIAAPEDEIFDFTIPIMYCRGKGYNIKLLNRDAKLGESFSNIEIALGTVHFKDERLREAAKKLFNEEYMGTIYNEIVDIVERNDYHIERSIGQYNAHLDFLLQIELEKKGVDFNL